MPVLLQYLYAIGAFQGFILSALLLCTPSVSDASRILGVWCVFLAIGLTNVLNIYIGENGTLGLLLIATSFLPASYGALLYQYCRHSLLGDRFQRRDLLHFLPFISCYLLNVDLFFSVDQMEQTHTQGANSFTVRHTLASVIMFGQAYVYMAYTAYSIVRYQRKVQNNYAGFNPDIFDWLWIVQGFNLIIWSFKAAAMFASSNLFLVVTGDLLIVVLIYGIGMAQWRNPQLFKIAGSAQEVPSAIEFDRGQQLSGALDEDTRASLLATVVEYMTSQQAFLDSDLSLRGLSEAVGVSTHHLSEVLNHKEGQNFYNFVNDYRIRYVCERLESDSDVKLLDLGLSSGFSSKSTFNSVFKKHTGLTPSQYRLKYSQ